MRTLLVAVLLTFPGLCAGQDSRVPRPTGTMFFELAGNALLGATANLEFALSRAVALRGGVGIDFYSRTCVSPLQTVFLLGEGSSKLELDAGLTIAQENESGDWDWDGTQVFFTGFVGYRYQRPGAMLFRIGAVPLLWTNSKIPWVAIGLGGTF